jgi:magnesium and cobalt transporter
MDNSIEGSPGAARSAQPEGRTESDETGGLLRRIIGIFHPNEQEDAGEEAPGGASGAAVFGVDRLRNVTVEDVAVPTAEIVAVPVDIILPDLVQVFRESGMSRLPVYEGTLDTPLGMIHLKDFALRHGFDEKGTPLAIRPMLRPLLYVPPSMPIGVLMQKMQAERRHMALVIDEYGGVDGLVTIEDLIEQVVGEIEDRAATSPPPARRSICSRPRSACRSPTPTRSMRKKSTRWAGWSSCCWAGCPRAAR